MAICETVLWVSLNCIKISQTSLLFPIHAETVVGVACLTWSFLFAAIILIIQAVYTVTYSLPLTIHPHLSYLGIHVIGQNWWFVAWWSFLLSCIDMPWWKRLKKKFPSRPSVQHTHTPSSGFSMLENVCRVFGNFFSQNLPCLWVRGFCIIFAVLFNSFQSRFCFCVSLFYFQFS